ncbi:MAG: hypothetical protein D3910_15135 [Candidatus Electrothrix sp. ATG2]|nr:hypothetical protein [Candidatus Electrothrix sp. ATG2]
MKIAVIYNRESKKVINLFGQPNREKYGLAAIRRIVTALKKGKHQVQAFEGDKDLIDRLEEFMPRTLVGERPGMAFNLSYGIQGQARYTHVPGILEMVGVPYVGSGPLPQDAMLRAFKNKKRFASLVAWLFHSCQFAQHIPFFRGGCSDELTVLAEKDDTPAVGFELNTVRHFLEEHAGSEQGEKATRRLVKARENGWLDEHLYLAKLVDELRS